MNFIKNLFGLSLRSKVMKVIDDKINQAQKQLDSELKDLNDYSVNQKFLIIDEMRDKLRDLRFEKSSKKSEIESRHINSILNKII